MASMSESHEISMRFHEFMNKTWNNHEISMKHHQQIMEPKHETSIFCLKMTIENRISDSGQTAHRDLAGEGREVGKPCGKDGKYVVISNDQSRFTTYFSDPSLVNIPGKISL